MRLMDRNLNEQTEAAIPQSSVSGNPRRRSKGAQRQIDEGGYTAKDVGMFVAENIPGVGEAILARDIVTDASKGDYASAALGTTALGIGILPGGDILNKPIKAAAKKLRKQDTDVANKMLKDVESIETWKKQNPNPKPQKQNPDIEKAANDLLEGDITGKQYRSVVKENMPIVKINEVPEVPSFTEIVGALDKDKSAKGIVGLNKTVEDGTRVASRLDIPAYERFDKWVVSVHDAFDKKGKESLNGDIIGYGKTAVLKNVEFKGSPTGAASISARKTNKSTIARIFGDYINAEPENVEEYARQVIKDKNWTQVGYNPFRHGFFYDKDTGMPVKSAEEVIQVGPLVLAKNAQKYKVSEAKQVGPKGGLKIRSGKPIEGLKNLKETKTVFNKGGTVMDRQMEMFEDGGLMDEGGTIDPVSGNDVPPGSTQEEVRDDIPAQLSEGEFVFPADVVRYIGLGNLMRMRQEAKMGLKLMDEMGQMGNSDEATIPDDMPFDINDLDMEDEPEYNVGGFVQNPLNSLPPGQGFPSIPPGIAPPNQQVANQQFGIAGYTPSAQPTTGYYQASPMQYGQPQQQPVQYGQQQFMQPLTPVAQAPVPTMQDYQVPEFSEFVGGGFGEYDELREYRNEAGNVMMIPFKDGSPISPIPEGYTFYDPEETETEEVVTTPTTPQTTQQTSPDDDGDSTNDETFITTDVTGIGYHKNKLEKELRDVINDFGAGFGTLGETFNIGSNIARDLSKDPRVKGSSLTSAALGGVLDAYRGGNVTFSDPSRMGSKKGQYADTTRLHEMPRAAQVDIATVARSVVGSLRNVFVDEEGKAKKASEVNKGLSSLAESLGVTTGVPGTNLTKSRTTLIREIAKAQTERDRAKLEKERREKEIAQIIKDTGADETDGEIVTDDGAPATTFTTAGEQSIKDLLASATDDGPLPDLSGVSTPSRDFSAPPSSSSGYEQKESYSRGQFYAEGGLAGKPKPKAKKKMKRGGLASKK